MHQRDAEKMDRQREESKEEAEQELKDKIKQMDKDGIVYCPKCYSTQITANKKGFFSLGKEQQVQLQ